MNAYTRQFDLALRGSKSSRKKMERDPHWRELLAAEQTVSSRLGDELRPFYSIGTLEAGALLNLMSDGDALKAAAGMDEHRDNPVVRAELEYLGDRIIAAAVTRLPTMIRRLARGWKAASADQQLTLLRQVMGLIRKTDDDKMVASLAEDFRDQANSRVLPGRYRTYRRGAKPNCIGKTQLVCAFARQVGARCYTFSPLARTDLRTCHELGQLQGDLAKLLIEHEPKPSVHFVHSLTVVAYKNLKTGSQPQMLHGAAIIELKDGRWILVDPNYRITRELEDQSQVKSIVERLERYREAVPGLALLYQPKPPAEKKQKKLEDLLPDRMQFLRRVLRRFDALEQQDRLTVEEIIKVLAHPKNFPHAKSLLYLKQDAKKKERPSKVIRAYLEDEAFLTAVRHDFGCKTVKAALNRLVRKMPMILCSRVEQEGDRFKFRVSATPVPAEIQRPEQFMAASVLGHLAYNAGCSAKVEEVLAEHVGGQFRQFYRCLRWCKGKRKQDERGKRVAEILRSMPIRFPSVDVVFQTGPRFQDSFAGVRKWLRKEKARTRATKARRARARSRKAKAPAPRRPLTRRPDRPARRAAQGRPGPRFSSKLIAA